MVLDERRRTGPRLRENEERKLHRLTTQGRIHEDRRRKRRGGRQEQKYIDGEKGRWVGHKIKDRGMKERERDRQTE